ncbi:GNAT family N-acetyltransferase [Mesorhizobium sp. M1E.F.Ca.ET.045.02.1.1]|nr:GNAT family N-acetyltransferase [Mesorhizobium sp. M1E.F.Ca.ET.045.02.1.1]RUW32221.1 GNAT family N-acetyltransferase [Mesorhizobium sp. M1E.F.Ca.ET.041.01.1.1]RUW80212.1 GNAT family N-acetyltransferase [Mesorhizobium sp. M1E.F.Ca.ET.063.01.1.1]RWD87944.1 MAG: GNAT family N-acetyltransferase [Mesorhizobium sp.]RWD94129.1 MAG: GNAT family N-acetyltransferase [Mesorhizobium sp.]
MDKMTKFPISLSGYEIEGLIGIDAPRLVPLYRACSDYVVLERGQPPDAASANEEFENFPPGRTEADKFVFGLKAADGELVGLLACDRDYPRAGCWWIALLMIDKAFRGKGLARALCDGFFTWLKSQAVERVELGVLVENEPALRFWRLQNFEPERMAGPIAIGTKQHMVQVLGRSL